VQNIVTLLLQGYYLDNTLDRALVA